MKRLFSNKSTYGFVDSYPMDIAFSVNADYLQYSCVTIKSIIINNSNSYIRFHIITEKLKESQERKIHKEFNSYPKVSISFYIIDPDCLSEIKKGSWSRFAWYRILLPTLLPANISKVLYLDADTIVNSDISSLFEIDMKSKSIAAVPDIISFRQNNVNKRLNINCKNIYVCSGVLMVNLDYWRKNNITTKIIDWAIKNRDLIVFPDQDSINYVCKDSKILLHLKYGILQPFFTEFELFDKNYLTQLKESIENPCIVHYAGFPPWLINAPQHYMSKLWYKYNNMLKHRSKLKKNKEKLIILIKRKIWELIHESTSNEYNLKNLYYKLISM